jgi:hypothetical protein
MTLLSLRSLAVAGGLLLCGCPRRPPAEPPAAGPPLAAFATQPVVVLPTHAVFDSDSLGWASGIERPRDLLRRLDDELAFALRERGLEGRWVFPPDLERAVRRNPGFAPDPYALAADALRPAAATREPALGEPLASQVRSLVALTEARYLLLPVELRFESAGAGMGRPVLRVAVIDARLSEVRWSGDVRGDAAPALSPAATASVAERLADLITPR